MASKIRKTDNVIDSDELRTRIEHLERIPGDGSKELLDLQELEMNCNELSQCGFEGLSIVNSSHLKEYTKQRFNLELMDQDCNLSIDDYPYRHIDWDAAAADWFFDNATVNFNGATFYCCSGD